VIVAITGASGATYGVRTLEVLADVPDVETHLVLSDGGRATLTHETGITPDDVAELADVVHDDRDLAAPIASGSYRVAGMVVAPCSIRTLSGIATSASSSLVVRAADVCLKDRRRLVLLVRETPLHLGHLRLMTHATEAGAIVFPPAPAMYIRPRSLDDVIDHTVMRVLDQLDIDVDISPRWHDG
jgi:4-hydroxy-3-polyprenylbenzoate decarboxylase